MPVLNISAVGLISYELYCQMWSGVDLLFCMNVYILRKLQFKRRLFLCVKSVRRW